MNENMYIFIYTRICVCIYIYNLMVKSDWKFIFVCACMSNHSLILFDFYCFFITVTPKNDYCVEADRNADYHTLEILFCIFMIKYIFMNIIF